MSSNNEYMRVYMTERYYRRKAAAIEQLGGRCARCGATGSLEFDHIERSTKSRTLGRMLASASEKLVQEELAKCQLLCTACHDQKDLDETGHNSRATHGTMTCYRYMKCRCTICKKANADYHRGWRHRRKQRMEVEQAGTAIGS